MIVYFQVLVSSQQDELGIGAEKEQSTVFQVGGFRGGVLFWPFFLAKPS